MIDMSELSVDRERDQGSPAKCKSIARWDLGKCLLLKGLPGFPMADTSAAYGLGASLFSILDATHRSKPRRDGILQAVRALQRFKGRQLGFERSDL